MQGKQTVSTQEIRHPGVGVLAVIAGVLAAAPLIGLVAGLLALSI